MAPDKPSEKRRKQKRDAERRRREKIKNNPEHYEKVKEKERERFHKQKEEGKIKTINELSARKKRAIRRRWKISSSKYRSMKKNTNKVMEFIAQNFPPPSPTSLEVSDNGELRTPSTSRVLCGRKRILRSKIYRKLLKIKEKLRSAEKRATKYKTRYHRLKKKQSQKKKIDKKSPRTQ